MSPSNDKGNSLNRAFAFISLAIFVLLIITAIALPIAFNVSGTLVITIFTLILSVLGVFFSFIQAFPSVKDHFKSLKFPNVGRSTALLSVLLILSIALNTILYNNTRQSSKHTSDLTSTFSPSTSRSPAPTLTITVANTPTITPFATIATDISRLIPPNQTPVLDDVLSSGNSGYQWDTGKAGGATCSFTQGAYHIQAPAGTGGGCGTEATSTNFTDFVYQVKMTILSGLDKGQGGVGPLFRGSSTLYGGSFYGISFDAHGVWTFGYAEGNSGKTLLGGTSPYFVTGLDQPNFITIRVQGSHIEASINNHDLFTISDTTLKMGNIGVQMGTGSDGGAEIAFSDAKVWQLA